MYIYMGGGGGGGGGGILGTGSGNDTVSPSLIGWAHIQNDPYIISILYSRPNFLPHSGLLIHDCRQTGDKSFLELMLTSCQI